jgi:hypothetical protein
MQRVSQFGRMTGSRVAVTLAVATLGASSGCGGQSAMDKANQNVAIANGQLAIALSVQYGRDDAAGGGDPLAATNELLDALHGKSGSDRRKEIDDALDTFAIVPGYCNECVHALESARP